MHPLRGRQVPPNKLSGSRAERQKKNDQAAKVSQPSMRSRDHPRNHGRALCNGAGAMLERWAVGAAVDGAGAGMNLTQINLATW
jgi:hypothetical protein